MRGSLEESVSLVEFFFIKWILEDAVFCLGRSTDSFSHPRQ